MQWEYGDKFLELMWEWLGVDSQGHVAVFDTVGEGMLPATVHQHQDEVDAVMDRVEEFRGQAAYGFYFYEWGESWVSCRYIRRFAPDVPVTVSQLPAELQAVAHYAEFIVPFADAPAIVAQMPPVILPPPR
jgi:hypothetical protein